MQLTQRVCELESLQILGHFDRMYSWLNSQPSIRRSDQLRSNIVSIHILQCVSSVSSNAVSLPRSNLVQ